MVSRRLGSVAESGTVRISNIVSKLKQEGIDILSLSMGEPDFPTPDNITDACISALKDHFTHYTPSAGTPELRRAVAEKCVRDNKIPCDAGNVLITPTKQAIFMSMFAMLDEGDEAIIPDPTWGTFDACVRLAGATPRCLKISPENDYRVTPERVAELINRKTKLILINSPSNPCGAVMTKKDVQGIADLAKDHDLLVFSDEVYEKIIYDGAKHYSIASLDGMFERTITTNGFSKTYAMTGWRIGWIVAPLDVVKEINKLQTHSLTCVTSFVQKAAVEALKGPQDSVGRMVDEFRARRDLMCDLMKDIPSLHCPRPKGAFYAFPKYDVKMRSDELAAHLLEKAHVAVTPGSAFGPSGEGFLRLSYAASREVIIEALERMEEELSKLPV
ncbi:MAG: pyridoxal phosphate-dependent aminotransferase [Methanomassiliicoccales archaeon]|nr:pyridoxal phosphate-dependent aminotransferase [Methanomassiliicoccales archaeon]